MALGGGEDAARSLVWSPWLEVGEKTTLADAEKRKSRRRQRRLPSAYHRVGGVLFSQDRSIHQRMQTVGAFLRSLVFPKISRVWERGDKIYIYIYPQLFPNVH